MWGQIGGKFYIKITLQFLFDYSSYDYFIPMQFRLTKAFLNIRCIYAHIELFNNYK